MTGWRALLRLAWRDTWRHKGRSALVLFMIALPVLAVTAADVIARTSDVAPNEAIERKLGTADGLVVLGPSGGQVFQGANPFDNNSGSMADGDTTPPTIDEVTQRLGSDTRAVQLAEGEIRVRTDKGVAAVPAQEGDLRDSIFTGTYTLESGRLPKAKGEIVVNPALAARGPGLGDKLEDADGRTFDVVGIAEDASYREPGKAWALPGALNLKPNGDTTWLLKTKAPITWTDVLALNLRGIQVLSREVVENPPPTDQLPPEIRENFQPSQADVAIFVLIVVMALIEVVLLAGPAFAVGARRMQRQLAVVGANGGTPGQVRRAVLATGVVLGGLAALGGLAIGIGLGWALLPVAQHWSNSIFGPFEVPWLHLVGVAAFGFVSAVIAAIVPAWIASRQDVVAVLSNRRGDRPSPWGPVGPALGIFLILVGLGLTGRGVQGRTGYGEIWIAFGAVFVVLGAVLLLRLFVALAARFAGRLPLPLRYAVRDAHRHRTRTVPAIGAVMATVAGVVALGIANASDEAANQASYQQQLPMGTGQVSLYSADGSPEETLAASAKLTTVVTEAFPDTVPLRALWTDRDRNWIDVSLQTGPDQIVPFEGGYASNQAVLVADELPAIDFPLSDKERAASDRALAEGEMVAFTSGPVSGSTVTLKLTGVDQDTGEPKLSWSKQFPVHFARMQSGDYNGGSMSLAVLPPALAKAVPLELITSGFVIPDQVTKAQEKDLVEQVEAVTEKAGVYVERGYQQPDDYRILLLVLGCLGALLMLGGTLTATFLALSDARPDLATLSAVGAGPRARRFVAASYALVLGLIGALVGAAIGFVPGIAATYPLTSNTWRSDASSSHTVAIPWLLIGVIVVALPLLTAAVVGLFAKSRLPVVARID